MTINSEWYRSFYWTAKTGSLSRAAEKLHITQPAVSHILKQLEGALGGQLFFRSAKGVVLTAEGEVLFRYIEQAFSFIESGEKRIAEMHNLESGEIRIGASDTLCKHYLMPYLEQFHQQYPQIRIHVTNRTTPETIGLLTDGKIDFGIINLPAGNAKIDIKRSLPQQDCLVGSKKYADLAGSGPLDAQEMHRYPLLMLEPGGSTRHHLSEWAAAQGIRLQPELELGSIDLLLQFAIRGFGLAFVIRNYIEHELAAGELVEIPLQPPLPERYIGIATLRGVPLSAASNRFLSMLPLT
ncbi:LysR family transcriptional regulator [Paenibacillus lignilyticus]|uniref:LysR family transcriptional regulator n=1 Tax=Paenibacillus lignilyticus TaxID=1172615 RepID=A0ABS5C5H8_9BACL|nr:LysR family transcriptional regulator [Paenibacillus lignilyticus]MBP3961225.1 LysR family transcriptional regulator [Paenibacillus lignilyticus]